MYGRTTFVVVDNVSGRFTRAGDPVGYTPPVRVGAGRGGALGGVRRVPAVGAGRGAACAAFHTQMCAVDVLYSHLLAGRTGSPAGKGGGCLSGSN